MNVRELLTFWKFEVKDEALKRVEGHLSQLKQGMDFLIGAQVVKKMIDIEQRFSQWAHSLYSVQVASGVAVESIQALTFAGKQFGATQDEITGAMTNMTLKINDARMGFEGAQRSFALAGFSADQFRSWKNGGDALMALADKMKATHDPMRRQWIAAQLGVSANSKLYAMLMQGSGALKAMRKEAEELGVILSGKDVKSLTDTQNALGKLMMALEGIGKRVAVQFAPSIKDATEAILAFYKANRQTIDTAIKSWIEDFTYALGYLYGALEDVAQMVFNFANAHPVLFKRITQLIALLGILGVAFMSLSVIVYPFIKTFQVIAMGLGMFKTAIGLVATGLSLLKPILIGIQATVYALGAALGVSTAAVWGIVAAIAAVIGAGVALWQHFVNGKDWKDTWIGKLISNMGDFFKKIPEKLGKIGKWLGLSSEETPPAEVTPAEVPQEITDQKMHEMFPGYAGIEETPAVASKMPAAMASSAQSYYNQYDNSSANRSSVVNAPITINVNGTANPRDLGNKVRDAVEKHFSNIVRNTHRSLKAQEAH